MNEFILIHYKPGHPGLHYWAMGGGQHPSITLAHGSLDELAAVARGKTLYLLIDAHYTTLESINVPSKNRNRQMQAVPFAMEDYLAEDIEDTHFALGHMDENSLLPVIAINRELLKQTLQYFTAQGINIDAISADSIATPFTEGKWTVVLDEDSALIRTTHNQSHCCDRELLGDFLKALLDQYEDQPQSILFHHKSDDEEANQLLGELDITVETETYKNHPLEIFVQHLNDIRQLNLLQGEFTPKRESNLKWLAPWKAAIVLCLVWMVIYLSSTAIQSNQLKQKNLQLSKQIEREFKRAMPEARKLSNMQKRVERKLKLMKGSAGKESNDSFLSILGKAADTLSNHDNINIEAAVYKTGHIDIEMTAKSLQDIESLKNNLQQISGIKTVLSTTVEKDKVNGRLRLESKG